MEEMIRRRSASRMGRKLSNLHSVVENAGEGAPAVAARRFSILSVVIFRKSSAVKLERSVTKQTRNRGLQALRLILITTDQIFPVLCLFLTIESMKCTKARGDRHVRRSADTLVPR